MSKIIRAKLDEAQAIQAAAEGRDLNTDELDKLEAIAGEVETLKANADKQAEIGKRLASVSGGLAPAQPVTAAAPQRVEVKEPDLSKDPNKGFSSSKEFFNAVIGATKTGRVDNRLGFLAAVGSDEHKTVNDADGGFLVPEGFIPQLLSVGSEQDPTVGRTTMVPMASPTVRIPALTDKNHSTSVAGGVTVARTAETGAISTSKAQFEQVTLTANTLAGATYVTEELLTDSPLTVASLASDLFGRAFRDKQLDEKLSGTGVGQMEGILNSPAFLSTPKKSGQAADTVVFENIVAMRSRCWGYQNAIWMANHNTMPQLAQLNDGTNNIWMPSAREDAPDMLMGRPLIFTEYTSTLGDANDILCVNWSQYLEGIYQPLQSAESVHVRFLNNERTFKMWLRNDGRAWWRSVLTPKKGSTLSPYVGLAARA